MQGNIKKNYKPIITEIRDTGHTYNINKAGYLVNDLSISMIQDKWLAAIHDIVKFYEEWFKDNVHSIYVRGSVAHGQAVDNISDLDIILILKERLKTEEGQLPILMKQKAQEFQDTVHEHIIKNHSFITHVDHGRITHLERLLHPGKSINMPMIQFYIKYLSIHVYGENIQDDLPDVKKEDAPMYHSSLIVQLNELEKQPIDVRMHQDLIQWIARRIIRSAFGLVYDDLNVWTRCLVPCYNLFIDAYPEFKKDMKPILDIAIFGIRDKTKEDYKKMIRVGKSLTILLDEKNK